MRESSLESLLLLATLFVIHEKHGKAATVLEGLYALAPRDERVLRLLCHSFVMENRNEEALEVLRELFSCAGDRMTAHETACALRLKASALWRLGRLEESRAVIESI